MEAMVMASDEEIVRRIASGDRLALASLYDRYAPLLLAQARRALGSPAEAEDLVHDVYLEVWRQAHSYSSARGTVRAWLSVRLRARALDRLRRAHNARRADGDVTELSDASVDEGSALFRADGEHVRRALAGLPADQRTVLELFYFDGLSLLEIGEKLTVPLGTVKSRASRALSRLRAELQDV